jgi:DNA polymerase-3 subunit epsilon
VTWAFGPLAPFDTESTGKNPEIARLVSATVAHVVPGVETQIAEHLVAVEEEIPAAAIEVHGITTEHAQANGKPLAEVAEAVASHLTDLMVAGTPIVGMNLSYDVTLLQRELFRCGLPSLEDRGLRQIAPLIDVFVIDKAIDRFRPGKRKLTNLCEFYGVRLDGAHDATFDALGAARVAYKMCQRAMLAIENPQAVAGLYADRPRQQQHIVRAFQALGRMSIEQLHAQQATWYRDQATGLRDWFFKEGNRLQMEAEQAAEDGVRETLLADAEEYRASANNMTFAWPMRPFGVAA